MPLAQTVVAWIVAGMEIPNRDLPEARSKGEGNGEPVADTDIVAVPTKAVVVDGLPVIFLSDVRTSGFEYLSEVA